MDEIDKTCKYEYSSIYSDGDFKCNEKALSGSDYCILHIDFPGDKNSHEFKDLLEKKDKKVKEKIKNNDFYFQGAQLPAISINEINESDNDNLWPDDWGSTSEETIDITLTDDVNFSDAKIWGDVDFGDVIIEGDAYFNNVIIEGNAYFWNSTIKGYGYFDKAHMIIASFENSHMEKGIDFNSAYIKYSAVFNGAEIKGAEFANAYMGDADFGDACIMGDADFRNVKIEGLANFNHVHIRGSTDFSDSTIIGNVDFIAATLDEYFYIMTSDIKKELLLTGAKFSEYRSEEVAHRKAKHIYEGFGDKFNADKHFYLEMVAKRKQKYFAYSFLHFDAKITRIILKKLHYEYEFFNKEINIYLGYLELPIQYCFGYGVYPLRIIGTTLAIALIFAGIFWLGEGLIGANTPQAYIYFSFINALKLGSLEFQPSSGTYQLLATLEAIIGTFLWAAFVGTFARKFMR